MLDLDIKSAKEVKQERKAIKKCAYQVYKYLINATTKFIEDNYQDLLQQSVNQIINHILIHDEVALQRASISKACNKEFLYLSSDGKVHVHFCPLSFDSFWKPGRTANFSFFKAINKTDIPDNALSIVHYFVNDISHAAKFDTKYGNFSGHFIEEQGEQTLWTYYGVELEFDAAPDLIDFFKSAGYEVSVDPRHSGDDLLISLPSSNN